MKKIKIIKKLFFASLVFFMLMPTSCMNVDEEVYSGLTGENFFDDPNNLIYAFGAAYTNMYQLAGHKFGLLGLDAGTDILVVPQRGGDWFDGGEWHRWHRHTWTPAESYIDRWWGVLYYGVNTCNRLILQFEKVGTDEANIAISELRAFRALYYYWLIDLYGEVPIVDRFDVPADYKPAKNTRPEVYDFIESELLEAMPLLSKDTGIATHARVNYYVAQMILAKLYMNAEVFKGSPEWAKANAALDTIINSGKYQLESDFFDNFKDNSIASKETIFGVPFDQTEAKGFEVHLFSLHYNLQEKYGIENKPWNGLSAQEAFFDSFEDADLRRNGLLFGKQYDADGNQILDPGYEKFDPTNPTKPRDLDGPGLNLDPHINMLEPNCLRQSGARIVKWPIIPGSDRYMSNDFPVFRYADVLLLKAEVNMRGGFGDPLPYVNEVRARAGVDPFTDLTYEKLLAERGRELYAEGHRRNDMIRFGVYGDPIWEKPDQDDPCKTLWPIPEKELNVNSNLVQNPCYQ